MNEQIAKELKEKGKVVIFGIGTLYLMPRRNGKINGVFGDTPKYKKRVKFVPSLSLKNKTCL